MRTELFISWRYLLTRRKEKFISLISVISLLGVAIGVMALIVVIGVMSGFDKDLREKIVGNFSHITITSFRAIDDAEYQTIEKKLKGVEHVAALSPYIQGQLLLKEGNRYFAVALRGIDAEKEARVTKIKEYLTQGSLEGLGEGKVLVGKELAASLGLELNSSIQAYSALGKQYSLQVAGIFSSGMYDYDLNLVFTDLKTAQQMLGLGSQITAIAVNLDNPERADKVKRALPGILGYEYLYKTWMEMNQNFFAALKLEKLTMFIILTLIVLVASFNIISTLIVMVVEKTKDIGVLKALGMNGRSISTIFTLLGLTIGVGGTLVGTAGGLVLCGLLKKYQFIKLPQDIYYIDRLPVSIELWPDVILIVLAAISISLVSTIYPAIKASGLKPVEALRYE